jgi:hypothetical protein
MHQHHIAWLRATEYQHLREFLRNLARMHCLFAADIFHEVEVEPAVGHAPLLSLRYALADALVGRILIRLGDLLLEKLVVRGLATVQDATVGGREPFRAVPHIRIVDPHIVLHLVARLVQKAHAQVGVLLGIVDEKHVTVVFQHAQRLARQLDVPFDILLERAGVRLAVVAHADIVVGVAEDHVHRPVGQLAH